MQKTKQISIETKGLLQEIPKVALFMATNEKAGRDKLQGILRYVRLHTPWNLHLVENRMGEQKPGDLHDWGVTGIIVARMPEFTQIIEESNVPTVVLDSPALYNRNHRNISFVTSDSKAIGIAGAKFLIRQGFTNFGYVPDTRPWDWSQERGNAFAACIKSHGYNCVIYEGQKANRKSGWASEQKHLANWLQQLPKPTALLVARDGRARQVIETCQSSGLNTPGDIAVLGVDNEEVLCENTNPSLASIQPSFDEGGYQAAALLENMMRGMLKKPQKISYGVKQIILRTSGRSSRTVDRRLLRGLEFIRLNVSEPISVLDVARHMQISRRMAEMLFRNNLDRSILDEISNARLARLENFLLETTLPIGQISLLCGYQTEMHAKRIFKKQHGITMSQFRK
jgi:LacI family transcriptional regulator